MTFPLFFHTVRCLRSGCLVWALCALLWQVPVVQAQPSLTLPSMGDGADMTSSEERQLGDRIIRSLYRDPDYVDDPQLHAYVMRIWSPLVQAAQQRGDLSPELSERFAWQILLGRDASINAFALPGGYLGVHLGLMAAVSSSDELASVLAHELTHVTQRHIARRIGQEKKGAPLMVASMILGALAASKSPDAANALMVGGQAALVQNQLGFSRDMEREADRIGHGLLAPAGFSPQGAVSMFEKLQQASRLNDNASWPYLRSHPLTSERMADMQQRVPQGATALPLPSMEHAMLAGRARVLARPGIDRLRQWSAQPLQPEFAKLSTHAQAGQWYAAIVSQIHLRDLQHARQSWRALQQLVQAHGDANALQQLRWLRVELELADGQPAAAQSWLASGELSAEAARPELLWSAQVLLAVGRSPEAAERLQLWVTDHPQDATAWRWLAQAWQAQGFPLRALRAEAESYVAHYDYAAAIDRFKAGQDAARRIASQADYMDASIIDTRLREVQSLWKLHSREP